MKKILALCDRGVYAELMEGFAALKEAADLEVEVYDPHPGETPEAFQHRMLRVETEGPETDHPSEELFNKAADAHILIVHFQAVGRKLMDAAKQLEKICVLRTGVENVNLEEAKRRGIQVICTPGRAATAVADFTVALALSEIRNIARSDADIKAGKWVKKYPNMSYSHNLNRRVFGLIGFGIIGQKVADRLKGFGCDVIVYDPYTPEEILRQYGCKGVSLEKLLGTADYISLHSRLTRENTGMIGKEQFSMMKPTAIFINTARAGLVDEAALIEALQNRTIGGAALDVFSEEPLREGHPLLHLDNVTLTAHFAGTSTGTFSDSITLMCGNLDRYFRTGEIANAVV